MTTNLYNIIRYNPATPGTTIAAQVYGRREANAIRDSMSAKNPGYVFKVRKAS